MNYKIEKYKLKNGIEGVTVIFEEDKYKMLSSFFTVEITSNLEEIGSLIDNVLSGKITSDEYDGNIYHIYIGKDTCVISNNIDDFDDEEDEMGEASDSCESINDKICTVNTLELKKMIGEFENILRKS